MDKIKVAVNGYGTIGKRIADAVSLQKDMEIVGVSKTKPNFEAFMALEKGYSVYSPSEKIKKMKEAGIEVSGSIEDMTGKADIIVDCTPGGVGEKNKPIYEDANVKVIWQGGEDHELAGFSFNAIANYEEAIGKDLARVVSCNTTGLCRVLYPLDKEFGVKKARVSLLRRAADPGDIKTGPINAIVPNPVKLPSHHGPDVKSVMPHIDITTTAVKLPTTLMHVHIVNAELATECNEDDIKSLLGGQSRIKFVGQGVSSTAEVMEMSRDMLRPRSDMWENCLWEDSVSIYDNELYFFQAIHQESIVVPDNIDAIRAMMEIEGEGTQSIEKTNRSMGIV